MDETIRITVGQESGFPKIMVHTDDIVLQELNESTSKKKFQSAVTVCKDFG